MIESGRSLETSKNSIETLASLSLKVNAANKDSESLQIKPKQQSKFEGFIINAYKSLTGFSNKNDEKSPKKDDEKLCINECESELRNALNELESFENIFINKNIIDKINRITNRNIINLSLIIGQIYIQLMSKQSLFSKLNKENSLDKNIIISFINEVINMNFLLKKTYLCFKYENALFNFLENIIKEIPFDSEQLDEINVVLQDHKAKQEEKKLNMSTSKEFLTSLNEAFNAQNSLYGQYKVIMDNCQEILELFNKANLGELSEVNNFLEFGVLIIKLFFGRNCILLNEKSPGEESVEKTTIVKLFDGFEDKSHGNIDIILGQKFFVDYDEDLEPMREGLCELIIKYIEKFKNITNLLEFQYVHFVLLKRIYFYYFEKFGKEITPLFAQVLINLCAFKADDKIRQVVQFVNLLLNSEDEKDADLKAVLAEKIEDAKKNADFNINFDNQSKVTLDQIQNEFVYIEEDNLNLGFFTNLKVESGEAADVYVELSKPFGVIDFSLVVKNYDLNLEVTNLTEGNTLYEQKKLKTEDKTFKLTLFFTKPGIFRFKFDNSYSWITDKDISYKINTFYPQIPNVFENKVAISRYQEALNNMKKMFGKKNPEEIKLDIVQNQLSYQYNITDIKDNIEMLNPMIVASQIKILTIYLDKEIEEEDEKKYFYYEKEDLVKKELTEENFEEYINENKNKSGNTIVNLFIISGDETEALPITDLSLGTILGFEPEISEDSKNSVLYFIQYYNQAQLLYYLINKAEEQQNAFLINYTKFGGYQYAFYVGGAIVTEIEELKNLKKKESLKNNIALISECIKKLGKDNKINLLVTDSIDSTEKTITSETLSTELQKSLGINSEEEGNYKIIRLNKDYNKEFERYTHLLNLID